jgi:hypothetical protein
MSIQTERIAALARIRAGGTPFAAAYAARLDACTDQDIAAIAAAIPDDIIAEASRLSDLLNSDIEVSFGERLADEVYDAVKAGSAVSADRVCRVLEAAGEDQRLIAKMDVLMMPAFASPQVLDEVMDKTGAGVRALAAWVEAKIGQVAFR